jgi:hypothetical protein
MLLDRFNAELLKLIAVCKDFPIDFSFNGSSILNDVNVRRLLDEDLLCISSNGCRYRVTRAGYDVLNHAGFICQPDEFRESDEQMLTRREQAGQIMLTLMMAGIDVFADSISQLKNDRSYIHAGIIRKIQRQSRKNLSGNLRFIGLMGGSGYAFYYVSNSNDSIFHHHEAKTVKALFVQSGSCTLSYANPAVVYMGTDYHSLCAAVTGTAGRKADFRSAYDNFPMPVHLCPCTPDGAIQIRVTLQSDYRKRLINLLFPDGNALPPDPSFAGSDGMFDGNPFILGVDMDLRRIQGLVRAAREADKSTSIFSRPCQTEALQAVIPNDSVCFYNIRDDEIINTFGFLTLIDELTVAPYITPKGGYIDDKTIRDCREARKARQSKDKASQSKDTRKEK